MDDLRFATSPRFAWLLPPELWGEIEQYVPDNRLSGLRLLGGDAPPVRPAIQELNSWGEATRDTTPRMKICRLRREPVVVPLAHRHQRPGRQRCVH